MHLHIELFPIFLVIQSCFGKKSFTIVLDTTLSMQDEIDNIRSHILSVTKVLKPNEVDNYVLLPFNDPDVGTALISSDAEGLVSSLNRVIAEGGHDCPEDSLAAIQKALEVSSPESTIFLFTDAYAKDNSRLEDIMNLCRRTHSQVVTFLSGACTEKQGGSVEVYNHIAKSCSGGIYPIKPTEMGQAFTLMKEILQTEWTEITTKGPFSLRKELRIPIDTYTTAFILAIYGDYTHLQIYNRNGETPQMENIMNTTNTLVVRLTNLQADEYRAIITCRRMTSVTIYRRKEFPFQYGFSTRLTKKLRETSLRPIPGWTNYILIVLPESSTAKLQSLELNKINKNDRNRLTLEENEENNQIYTTSAFFEPNTFFRISVSGKDSNNQDVGGTTKIIETQKTVIAPLWTVPVVEILAPDSTIVEYNQGTTIVCKINGYPKPNISWEDENGTPISAEEVLLEIPSVYLSYATVEQFSKNTTFYCNAKNAQGEDRTSLELFVHRPISFEVKQTPTNQTIEYGTEGRLYCEAEAYPAATITWYQNDTLLSEWYSSKNIEIKPDDHMLLIKNMTLRDSGEYKCEVKNEYETRTFTAVVSISGLEAPHVEINQTEVLLKPSDFQEIECKVSGNPVPDITWKFYSKSSGEYSTMPEGIVIEGNILKMPSVKLEYSGTYRCEAFNIVGEAYNDVTVTIHYEPVVKLREEALIVREGEMVEIVCEVDAMPEARVWWEMMQDDIITPFDSRHTTDDHHTHRFDALWKDSGTYHCIAENDLGRVEKTVTVNVLVAPFIQNPERKTVPAKAGSTVVLTCNVLYGHPAPARKWEFIARNTANKVLIPGESANVLYLTNFARRHEGTYTCFVENEVGFDTVSVRVYLDV